MLRHAAAWALEALADAVTGEGGTGPLRHVLEHLRQNRCAARGRLAGERVCRWLAEVIEVRLATTCAQGATTIIPVRIAATQIATAQLALIRAWLSGRDPCPTDAIVDALARTSRAMATAVLP
ncbi:MAG TPA: hypothetical protein VFY93_01995 [Planctomycetota bacterium]|nr:hypothetical protein [Planctomycetota bacterium]